MEIPIEAFPTGTEYHHPQYMELSGKPVQLYGMLWSSLNYQNLQSNIGETLRNSLPIGGISQIVWVLWMESTSLLQSHSTATANSTITKELSQCV